MAVSAAAEVAGQGIGGGDGVGSGLDLDSAVAAGGADESPDRPACPVFGQRLTGMAANPIVRWAPIESRRWWQAGRACRFDSAAGPAECFP